MIRTEKLTKIFRTEEVETTALLDVDIHVKRVNLWRLWAPQDAENQPY